MIGVDLGGTKIEACLLGSRGEFLYRERRATPKGDYQATLLTIRELLIEIDGRFKTQGKAIGIGTPGALVASSGKLKNSNSTWLLDKPLREDLRQVLGRPVFMSNDANCFTLSEARDGAGQGSDLVFGVILGTGVGGGFAFRGEVWEGPNAIAGEFGHCALPRRTTDDGPNRACYCGKMDCVETYVSGPAVEAEFQQLTKDHRSVTDIESLALEGNPLARKTMDRFFNRLARSLAEMINLLDPSCIVFGGGLSNLHTLYEELPERVAKAAFGSENKTQFRKAIYGDSSGVRGAAWLPFQKSKGA